MKMRTIENRTIFHRDGTISYYSRLRARYVRHASELSSDEIKQFDSATAVEIIDRLSEKIRKRGELRKSVACRMFEKIFFHAVRYRLGREPRKGELGYLLPNGGGRFLKADIRDQITGHSINVSLGGKFEYIFYGNWTVAGIKSSVMGWVNNHIR